MKRGDLLCLALFLVMILIVPTAAYAGKSDVSPNATTVEIVKKEVVKGVPLMGPPAKGPKPYATRGIIGEKVSGTRHAIVIGISDYPGAYHVLEGGYDLSYAGDDAISMAFVLENIYGFENIRLLVDRDAFRPTILAEIANLKRNVGKDDEIVFFFSGHGVKYTPEPTPAQGGGKVGIATWGWENPEEPADFYLETISDMELREAFSGFETDRIVFIFDSCLAGGMIDLGKGSRVISMATTQTGVAAEAWPGEFPYHGLFTYAFVELGMMHGLADFHPADGSVTVEEAFDFSRFILEEMSRQIPIFWQIPTIKDSFVKDLLL